MAPLRRGRVTMVMDKKASRQRRALRARMKLRDLCVYRLCVHRTPRHIYAQVISPDGGRVIASASTLEKAIRGTLEGTGNVAAAGAVGKAIAEKAKAAGVTRVGFDRAGFRYHGRVKALAEAAREGGLEF